MEAGARPILEMKGISIEFPGVKALAKVDFRLFPGEVHALMGQNGAGKSTLIKALTGVYRLQGGAIELAGQAIAPGSPQDAQRMGISTVYQEVNLCPNLTVAENIYIGRQPIRLGRIHWKKLNEDARAALAKLNIHIDVTQPLAVYSVAVQQMVAIARALDVSARILILDEPTSSLDEGEVELLFQVIRRLRDEGLAVLFVTHFLDQTYQLADRITVLRNGELVGESRAEDLPKLKLIEQMVGKEVDLDAGRKAAAGDDSGEAPEAAAFIEATALSRKGSMQPFDLKVRKGEVLGLAGLLGSGRTETARLLFGVDRADHGSLRVEDRKTSLGSPRQAIRHGIGFCPEDRKTDGIIGELTLRENIVLALQAKRGIFRYLSRRKQEEIAERYIKLLGIKASSTEQAAGKLSGGNQQKAILARWLATDPRCLILDEPTRGIDVGAKAEIMDLVLSLCREGMAILFISSELEEVVRCSHRVAVLRDRSKIAELDGAGVDEHAILQVIARGQA
ncbi:MAG TPA: sugar ABC transporter ATP-binding protein [Holophaga sp.]|nr:sugar ABC transporter ATP-binding protein [Holophaga sp.]